MKPKHTRSSLGKVAPPTPAPAPVYIAEADPRQAKGEGGAEDERERVAAGANEECTRAFGPWVRAADGTWARDRRQARGRG